MCQNVLCIYHCDQGVETLGRKATSGHIKSRSSNLIFRFSHYQSQDKLNIIEPVLFAIKLKTRISAPVYQIKKQDTIIITEPLVQTSRS